MSRLSALRYHAGAAKPRLTPTPEKAAWRQMCRAAEHVPRHQPGRIRVLDYDLEYVDLLSTCPQWEDPFVLGHQRFTFRLLAGFEELLHAGQTGRNVCAAGGNTTGVESAQG